MRTKFLQKKVVNHFSEAANDYAGRKGIVHSDHDPVILNFICSNCSPESNILEVGGGSGYFLDMVSQSMLVKALYNCELAFRVYKKQVNDNIRLIGGSALALPFKDDVFDCVVIKNLLHHLVGRSRRESKENSWQAISELCRVTRNKGHVVILEQYNEHDIFASAVFYITLILSLIGVVFKPLGLRKNVIVSFLTAAELKGMLVNQKNFKVDIVIEKANRVKVPSRYKLTFVMSNIGRILLIGKVLERTSSD
jgi:ubiquinone/menaquinone biosynthesis C-methylase UbiE